MNIYTKYLLDIRLESDNDLPSGALDVCFLLLQRQHLLGQAGSYRDSIHSNDIESIHSLSLDSYRGGFHVRHALPSEYQ